MAEARKFMQKTEKLVIKETPAVELILSEDEAKFLMAILGTISGNPDGPRGFADDIGKQLTKLGYGYLGFHNTIKGMLSPAINSREEFIKHYDTHNH